MTARFSGKNIIVTGGTSGIGKAAVLRLAKEGAKVLATGTNTERLSQLEGVENVIPFKNDAGSVEGAQTLAQKANEVFSGRVDGVFFNAGFGQFFPVEQVTAQAFDAQYNVNVRGPLLQTKALSEFLVSGSSLVMNASIAAHMGMSAASIYGPTKAALRATVRVLAREFAPRQIRVNAVSPGPIESAFFTRTGMPQEQIEQMGSAIQSQVPLGRFGTSDEAAAVALFLLSEDASFVTGSEYVVDGGMLDL